MMSADQEGGEVGTAVEAVGHTWDDVAIDFHDNRRDVQTASAAQASSHFGLSTGSRVMQRLLEFARQSLAF